MGIFDTHKNDSADSEDFMLTIEQTDAIMERLNKLTSRSAFRLRPDSIRTPTLFDSKFGGLPYWDKSIEYPTDNNGEKLMLLAQINLEDTGENDLLPSCGLLQFFIRRDDDLYGCNFNDGTKADGFRVVWHEKIDKSITEEDVRSMGIPSSAKTETCDVLTPITGEIALNIEATDVSMGMEVYDFEELFLNTAKELGIDIPEDESVFLIIPDEWHNEHPNPNIGHWILGYPYFTQFDPRYTDNLQRFDTLLLQIDSDFTKGRSCEIMWGDAGVGSFFINSDDLKNKNFSCVLYTWDCS